MSKKTITEQEQEIRDNIQEWLDEGTQNELLSYESMKEKRRKRLLDTRNKKVERVENINKGIYGLNGGYYKGYHNENHIKKGNRGKEYRMHKKIASKKLRCHIREGKDLVNGANYKRVYDLYWEWI